jgi:hypothetical protein
MLSLKFLGIPPVVYKSFTNFLAVSPSWYKTLGYFFHFVAILSLSCIKFPSISLIFLFSFVFIRKMS